VPAYDDGILGHGGVEMVQLYCGTSNLITAVFPMKNKSEIFDFIRKIGAPNGIFNDNAKVQIGTSASFGLLSLLHTTYILNRLSTESLDWLTPHKKVFGQKPDISAILALHWWVPVYYSNVSASYPNTKEC
jgi:hypothetical protein